jgi:hypothetical protein
MWKLGLRPRYCFSGNICFKISVICLCSEDTSYNNIGTPGSAGKLATAKTLSTAGSTARAGTPATAWMIATAEKPTAPGKPTKATIRTSGNIRHAAMTQATTAMPRAAEMPATREFCRNSRKFARTAKFHEKIQRKRVKIAPFLSDRSQLVC